MTNDGTGSASPLIRWTLYRPVTVLVVFVAILVVGIMAYPRIAVQLMPPGITTGSISVWIPIRDGTPQEVMDEVTRPAEDRLRTIPGVRAIYSASSSSRCYLRVEFDPELDADTIAADIRERMDRAKRYWPAGVDRYNLWRGRMDSDMPIYIAAFGVEVEKGPDGEEVIDVNDVFENVIQNRLLAIDGVARVSFWGLVEKRVTIDLDNDRVGAYNVPVRELIQRLGRDNQNITGGKIRDGDREYLVRSVGRFEDFEEIRRYPVTPALDVGDVADVRFYRALANYYSRVNGHPSKVVVLHKDSMANTIEVCRRVETVMDDLAESLPRQIHGVRGIDRLPFLNQGRLIEMSIGALAESGAWGGLFAMAVLLVFFRHVRVTILVTLAIPFSLLITVVWIYFRQGTFNILSLMGMSLGIGMLVDNSIVVVENIVRKQDGGLSPLSSAVHGLREVGLAVSLATLTTVVVFLPIMFMGDPRFRSIYQEVGAPLCVSVLASLLVALVFIPQGVIVFHRRPATNGVGAQAGGPGAAEAGSIDLTGEPGGAEIARNWAERKLLDTGAALNRATRSFLSWCLEHRFVAFSLFMGILISTQFIFRQIPKNFDMEQGSSRMELRVDLPRNLTLSEANDIMQEIEGTIYDPGRPQLQKRFGIRAVTSWFNSSGGGLNIVFEAGTRIKEEEFFNRIRDTLPRIPGVRVKLRTDMFNQDDTRKQIRVYIRGPELEVIGTLGDMVERMLKDKQSFPELFNVSQMRDATRDEVRVSVRRELAQHYGIDARSVANMVSWAIRGAMLPDYVTEDRELPFWIRYQDADKENIEELDGIPVYGPDGQAVRLENLASYAVQPGPGEIRRMDGKMTVAYSASAKVEPEEFFALRERIAERLQSLPVPDGFEVTMDGADDDFSSLILAGVLAIVLVFFVMGLLFESVILPFSVLLSIPHAFFGSIWALYLSGVAIDPVGLIGMVMLVGIVVNNAIVLVDTINRKRNEGRARLDAILEASRVRFRPIWMTAMTTIFGLVPLVILPQRGEGIDYKSMAIVLMGGLATSTFFTLFVVPLFYTLLDDLRRLGLTIVFRPEKAMR